MECARLLSGCPDWGKILCCLVSEVCSMSVRDSYENRLAICPNFVVEFIDIDVMRTGFSIFENIP